MEKADIIKWRNTLKAGKNWPLIVYIDNTFRLIDESKVLQFTKWDDENGILYNYSLTNPILDDSPSNIGGTISLFSVAYEHIQAMEVARMNLTNLSDSIDSIGCISEEWKKRIIERFEKALNPQLVNLTARDINKVMGVIDGQKALNDNDEYYENRFTQSFAETGYIRPTDKNSEANESVDNDSPIEDNTNEPNVDNTENTTEGE